MIEQVQSHKEVLGVYWGVGHFIQTCAPFHKHLLLILALILLPVTNSNSAENLSQDNKHHLVFHPQGQLAASVSYIHVVIPVNISALVSQAQPLFKQFARMQALKAKNLTHLPFCKNMADLGKVFEARLFDHLQHLQDLTDIMPQDTPNLKQDKQKRVPWLLLLIPRLVMLPWAMKTIAVAKVLAPLVTLSTVIGTSAHLVIQANKQAELNAMYMNETKLREQELDDLIATYKKNLQPTQSPRPDIELKQNKIASRALNETLMQASAILPTQYLAHFNFAKIVPPPPPAGWEQFPKLIEAYTDDLNRVNDEITDQINVLKENPYIVRPAQLRLTRQKDTTPLDDFRAFFLSLSSWDHQPIELPSPSSGLDDEFPSISALARTGRSVDWAALTSVVTGTFLGLYTSMELGHVKDRLTNIEKSHNLLVHLSNQQDLFTLALTKDIAVLRETMELMITYDTGTLYAQLDKIMSQWEHRLQQLNNILQQAQHKRLAIDTLTPSQLNLLHQSVLAQAATLNRQLLTHQPSDYFQLELSYAKSGSDFILLLHVPTVASADTLSIYQFVPFPFPLPQSASQSQLSIRHSLFPNHDNDGLPDLNPTRAQFASTSQALYLDMDDNLLAINSAQHYLTLSPSDLLSCSQHGHVFLCDQNNVLRTDLGETCLGALYFRSAEGVKAHCRFERRSLREEVYQTSPTSFLVFSPIQYTSKIECSNGTIFPIFIGQVTKVHINPGCQLSLNTHLLQPTDHIRLHTDALISEWSWDPLDLPSELITNGPHIDHYIKRLTHALQKLKTLQADDIQRLRHNQEQDIAQLRHDATLDSEFQPLLIKQMKTLSLPSVLFWFCFAISLLGCFGSAIFYMYYRYSVRRYPSLVEALESMQQLIPDEERVAVPSPRIRQTEATQCGLQC